MNKLLFIVLIILISSGCTRIKEAKLEEVATTDLPIKAVLSKDDNEYPLGEYKITSGNDNHKITYYLRDSFIDIRYTNCINKTDDYLEQFHRANLKELTTNFDMQQFNNISWGSFTRNGDYARSIPIAVLSNKSQLYQDYRENYPDSQLKYLNELFVDLANESNAYNDIKELFLEFNIKIKMKNVEKVFTAKVEQLPVRDKLILQGLNDGDRVIFDSGMIVFKIEHD